MSKQAQKPKRKSGGKLTPALCNVLGILLILAVIAVTVPLTLPRYWGYEIYNVVSGSMEPAIPIDSVLYVTSAYPEEVKEGDIIAFENEGSVVAHRVVINRTSLGEFVTKGDANEDEDPEPIPYDALVGRVEHIVPLLGKAMQLFSTNVGKAYLMMTAACGVMLNMVAERKRVRRRALIKAQLLEEKLRAEQAAAGAQLQGVADGIATTAEPVTDGATPSVSAGGAPQTKAPRKRGKTLRRVLLALLLVIFIGSAGVVTFVQVQHRMSDELYEEAVREFVVPYEDQATEDKGVVPPIKVDFKALQEVNPDVIGWLYCEDSTINYPVLHGETNDTYLRHDYTGEYNVDGSIFIHADNKTDFSDYNTIVYGHHMSTGTMFAVLDNWQSQEYYDSHPVMWLLTPKGDYRVDLLSAHHTSGYSDMYTIIHKPGKELDKYLVEALKESDFKSKAGADPKAHYVLLTTCAYIFEDARYVIHGKLVPVNTIGGVVQ